MSVTSVEALEALPVGQVISVKPSTDENPVDWVRRDDGAWGRSNGAVGVLDSHMFAGFIGRGWVAAGQTVVPAVAGQWRQGTSYWYLILAVDGASQTILRFRRNQNTDPLLTSSHRMTEYALLVEPPEIQARHWTTALRLLWERTEAETTARATDNERSRVQLKNRVDPASLHPALQQIRAAVEGMEQALANAPALDPF